MCTILSSALKSKRSRPLGPVMASETPKSQRQARNTLSQDIDGVVDDFISKLNVIAERHARNAPYVHSLADKENGHKTTLPQLLKGRSEELSATFGKLSNDEKQELLTKHLNSKEERDDTPKRLSNVAVSKAVSIKLNSIINMCRDLGRLYQTEILFLFSRGNVMHTYSAGAYASDGARNWLEHAEVGCDTAENIAMQMEVFAVSGISKRIKRTRDGAAKQVQRIVRGECRNIINTGLEQILKAKKHVRTDVRMNYTNYESNIVEKCGVALIGWPVNGKVQNPGGLSPDEGLILRNALETNECRWTVLTKEQRDARKIQNGQRERDGEQVYVPRKKRTKRSAPEDEGGVHLEEDDDRMVLHNEE
ncbi:hypothetical protein V8E52_008674 [Russula decolorans]